MSSALRETHKVSVKLMAGEEAEAIVDAVLEDNPGARAEDHGSYIDLAAEKELVFEMDRVSEELGRPYDVPTFLVVLSSYTGQVDVQDRCVTIREAMTQEPER